MNDKYLDIIKRLNDLFSKYSNYELQYYLENDSIKKIALIEKLKDNYIGQLYSWYSADRCLFGFNNNGFIYTVSLFDIHFVENSLASYLKAVKGSSLDEITFNLDMLGV